MISSDDLIKGGIGNFFQYIALWHMYCSYINSTAMTNKLNNRNRQLDALSNSRIICLVSLVWIWKFKVLFWIPRYTSQFHDILWTHKVVWMLELMVLLFEFSEFLQMQGYLPSSTDVKDISVFFSIPKVLERNQIYLLAREMRNFSDMIKFYWIYILFFLNQNLLQFSF